MHIHHSTLTARSQNYCEPRKKSAPTIIHPRLNLHRNTGLINHYRSVDNFSKLQPTLRQAPNIPVVTQSPTHIQVSPDRGRTFSTRTDFSSRPLRGNPSHLGDTYVLDENRSPRWQGRPPAPHLPAAAPHICRSQPAKRDRQTPPLALTNEHSKTPPARGTGGAQQAAGYRSDSPVTPTRWCPGACSCSRAPLG